MTPEEMNELASVLGGVMEQRMATLVDQAVTAKLHEVLNAHVYPALAELGNRDVMVERNLQAQIISMQYPDEFAQLAHDMWERAIYAEADRLMAEREHVMEVLHEVEVEVKEAVEAADPPPVVHAKKKPIDDPTASAGNIQPMQDPYASRDAG